MPEPTTTDQQGTVLHPFAPPAALRPGDRSVRAAASDGSDRVLPAAVLWDMDGTLIDSEPYWMSAETELVEAHGGVWTHADGLSMVGNPMLVSAAVLRSRGVALTDEEIVDFLNERVRAAVAAETPWQPGAEALLRELARRHVPLALVTSSFRVLADPFAATAGVFDVVVCGDEVASPKPDPEPYTTAAARLGVDVRRCVAVEDSPAGIASAVASGARVLALQVLAPIDDVPPGVSRARSLTDVGLDELARIAAGEVLDLRR